MSQKWDQDAIDDQMFDDDDDVPDDDEWWELECGLGSDGQCSQAGTEHCDFCCPNRMSELFAGSPAWRRKHTKNRA